MDLKEVPLEGLGEVLGTGVFGLPLLMIEAEKFGMSDVGARDFWQESQGATL
ncbi:hypothetical protein [Ferrimicrobium acidiphilum]|uniref:Uncharacterized protein n=1 Tax=Ferrimicrobium acidiphilum TaxID=121039 RepID=A0ABV3XZT8_9ACTN